MRLYSIRVLPARLLQFGASHGLARSSDEDLGYTCHAWLAAMFGELAPKPFRLLDGQPGLPARILGYGDAAAGDLLEHATQFADPVAFAAMEAESLVDKPLPDAWRPDFVLGFETIVCPTSRKDGAEKDVFLRRLDARPEARSDRAEVYREWIVGQLEPAATVIRVSLDGFRRMRLSRRSIAEDGVKRLTSIERPWAAMSGTLRIGHPDQFAALLRRGVGRHRAFGFGMLLLRPGA